MSDQRVWLGTDPAALATRLENYIPGENQDDVSERIAEAAATIRSLLNQLGKEREQADYWRQIAREDRLQVSRLESQLVKVSAVFDLWKEKLAGLEHMKETGNLTRDWGECSLICAREAVRDLTAALSDERGDQ